MNILQDLNKEMIRDNFNYRFRRDVLEGTLEEMLDNAEEDVAEYLRDDDGNSTISRNKRQAEVPGAPEQDETK